MFPPPRCWCLCWFQWTAQEWAAFPLWTDASHVSVGQSWSGHKRGRTRCCAVNQTTTCSEIAIETFCWDGRVLPFCHFRHMFSVPDQLACRAGVEPIFQPSTECIRGGKKLLHSTTVIFNLYFSDSLASIFFLNFYSSLVQVGCWVLSSIYSTTGWLSSGSGKV